VKLCKPTEVLKPYSVQPQIIYRTWGAKFWNMYESMYTIKVHDIVIEPTQGWFWVLLVPTSSLWGHILEPIFRNKN
jgi:hypothetical protein